MYSSDATKEGMISEAVDIIHSVDSIETLINSKLLDFQRLMDNHNTEEAERKKAEILHLLRKLGMQEDKMKDFMVKYRLLIHYEKKALLRNPR